jgi:hypothetical protein
MAEIKLNATEYKLIYTLVKPFESSMLAFVKTVITIRRLEYWRIFIVLDVRSCYKNKRQLRHLGPCVIIVVINI